MTSNPTPSTLGTALLGLSLFLVTPAFLCVCLYAHNVITNVLYNFPNFFVEKDPISTENVFINFLHKRDVNTN
ncbi:hypothetical protein TNCV_735281 [Trichonephila clavipes]|uniref:Uncharacterized protein n=1 Tax=Trichonephila clavipes TaxID=2585209 RepID=A0A8X6SMM4_TRICX|nr:hypothetical protein TNCV_735281 [Trichonephila clavipes]